MNTPPRRQKNIDRRCREYLTHSEIEKLIFSAKKIGRHGDRDAAMILVAYRHGDLFKTTSFFKYKFFKFCKIIISKFF